MTSKRPVFVVGRTSELQNFVASYRVSTQRQGASGLGLDAQRERVLAHVNGSGELIATFTEIESGRRRDRPELAKALAAAKRHRAEADRRHHVAADARSEGATRAARCWR